MKRPVQEVAGGPRFRARRDDVAGRSRLDAVARRTDLQGVGPSITAEDAALFEDFVEFLSDEDALEIGPGSIPDPIFQERLRGRLWRNLVMSRLPEGDEPH